MHLHIIRGRGLSEWLWQNCGAALCSDEELFVVKREEEHGCLGHTHGGERQGIPIMGGTGHTDCWEGQGIPIGGGTGRTHWGKTAEVSLLFPSLKSLSHQLPQPPTFPLPSVKIRPILVNH